MPTAVEVQTVRPRILAAVRREIPSSEIGATWKPALDLVWDFLRQHPGIRTDGHNIFVYSAGARPGSMVCDFGVEVARTFEPEGEVRTIETPGGDVAVAVHRGPYTELSKTYQAIEEWMRAHRRETAGYVWEIYADPSPDPNRTETTILQLLK
ncbi:GyrI-like domain-containing protein [Microbacterium sp. B2969]|uniref:GyrI-like domain-containing protein n=1 Tax=Microbacterium alkaliflavum TaxID=3248839 RepID=A0ABW7QDW0_9MICO